MKTVNLVNENLSDVVKHPNKMHELLGIPKEETIISHYSDGKKLAEDLLKVTKNKQEAASMLAFAANIDKTHNVLDDALEAIKDLEVNESESLTLSSFFKPYLDVISEALKNPKKSYVNESLEFDEDLAIVKTLIDGTNALSANESLTDTQKFQFTKWHNTYKNKSLSQKQRDAAKASILNGASNIAGNKFGSISDALSAIGYVNESINDEVKTKLIEFLKENPKPSDEKIHTFAENLDVDVHELEAEIYKLAGEHVNESATDFPSNHEIDENVEFIPMTRHTEEMQITKDKRYGKICKVSFSTAKVFYDILDDYYGKVFDNVDSSNVFAMKTVELNENLDSTKQLKIEFSNIEEKNNIVRILSDMYKIFDTFYSFEKSAKSGFFNVEIKTEEELQELKKYNLKIEEEKTNTAFVNECVVAAKLINGNHIIIKNRDRNYKPKVEIVHEIVDGIEMMYMHDKLTGWMEGMNEYGVCIANSALMVDADERAIELAQSNEIHLTLDGRKIIDALKAKTARAAIKRLATADYKEFGKHPETGKFTGHLAGHTIVTDRKFTYHFECDGESGEYKKIRVDVEKDVKAYTNHGINFEDLGYQEGFSRKSSEMRQSISEEILAKNLKTNKLLDALSEGFQKDPRLNPFRKKPQRGNRLYTTSQLAMNSERLLLTFRYNDDICEFDGVRVNLGERTPKIRLSIKTI